MNNTTIYLQNKKNILSVYFTADFPNLSDTKEIICSLQNAGANLIEIGIPFSDPLADGLVIQYSSMKAIENGFSLHKLFTDLHEINHKIKIPLVPMAYFNTVYNFGIENFLHECYSLNIDTVIIPDLPAEIYESKYKNIFDLNHVSPTFLITPGTPLNRIDYLMNISDAFLYVVSENSITGKENEFSEKQLAYFKRIKQQLEEKPFLIGFGISNQKTFNQSCQYANGAIVGSAFIKAIDNSEDLNISIHNFIKKIKTGIYDNTTKR